MSINFGGESGSSWPSKTVLWAGAIGLAIIAVIYATGFIHIGHLPTPTQATDPPPVDPSLKTEVSMLASEATIMAQLKAWALWLDTILFGLSPFVFLLGGALHLTHVWREHGMRVLRSAAIGFAALLLVPILIAAIPHFLAFRDAIVMGAR